MTLHRLRFSLRSLLIGITLLSVGLAGGSWWCQRAWRQAAAVAKLRSMGVRVTYSHEQRWSDGEARRISDRWTGYFLSSPSAIARWTTSLLGPDLFFAPQTVLIDPGHNPLREHNPENDEVTFPEYADALSRLPGIRQLTWSHATVNFDASELHRLPFWTKLESLRVGGRGLTDDYLAAIGTARNLRVLELYEKPHSITDAGFAHLANLTKMEELSLRFTKMDGEGVRHLSGMLKLRKLDLSWSGVDDNDLKHLSLLKELAALGLMKANIRGAGLADMGEKPKLQRLLLDFSAIDDDGLKLVSRFTELRELGLYQTHIEGPGLVHLQALTKLEELAIGHNPISDDNLRYLPRIETLKSLDLEETPISDSAINSAFLPPNLEDLYISNTAVTDAVINQLLLFPKLTYIRVEGTQLTAEGLMRLESERPTLWIDAR